MPATSQRRRLYVASGVLLILLIRAWICCRQYDVTCAVLGNQWYDVSVSRFEKHRFLHRLNDAKIEQILRDKQLSPEAIMGAAMCADSPKLRAKLAYQACQQAPENNRLWQARAMLLVGDSVVIGDSLTSMAWKLADPNDEIATSDKAIKQWLAILTECQQHDPENALYDYLIVLALFHGEKQTLDLGNRIADAREKTYLAKLDDRPFLAAFLPHTNIEFREQQWLLRFNDYEWIHYEANYKICLSNVSKANEFAEAIQFAILCEQEAQGTYNLPERRLLWQRAKRLFTGISATSEHHSEDVATEIEKRLTRASVELRVTDQAIRLLNRQASHVTPASMTWRPFLVAAFPVVGTVALAVFVACRVVLLFPQAKKRIYPVVWWEILVSLSATVATSLAVANTIGFDTFVDWLIHPLNSDAGLSVLGITVIVATCFVWLRKKNYRLAVRDLLLMMTFIGVILGGISAMVRAQSAREPLYIRLYMHNYDRYQFGVINLSDSDSRLFGYFIDWYTESGEISLLLFGMLAVSLVTIIWLNRSPNVYRFLPSVVARIEAMSAHVIVLGLCIYLALLPSVMEYQQDLYNHCLSQAKETYANEAEIKRALDTIYSNRANMATIERLVTEEIRLLTAEKIRQ